MTELYRAVWVEDNAKIGANAVVVKDVPKDAVMVGIPAKNTNKDNIIKSRYKFDFKDVLCKIGDVLIFSQCLVHKSGNNNSNSVRFSIQIRFNDLSKKDSISKILKDKFNLQKSNKAI